MKRPSSVLYGVVMPRPAPPPPREECPGLRWYGAGEGVVLDGVTVSVDAVRRTGVVRLVVGVWPGAKVAWGSKVVDRTGGADA